MIDFNEFNRTLIAEFRANGGQVSGQAAGWPLLLLNTVGARSGQTRTTPLVYITDGDRLVIVASKGGAPSNPDWYYNILANPNVTIELGGETFQARATPHAEGAERDRLFTRVVEQMPNFADYAQATTRTIPVVVLERIS